MISRNARALLDTIRLGEGTSGPQGYNTMFTGKTFSDLSRHPNQVNHGGGYSSAAAGGYQFLPATWDGVAKRLGLADFSPESQDRAALQLIRDRGVDPDAPLNRENLAKLAPEWASLPTLQGSSYYGQPVKPAEKLLGHYQQRLEAIDSPDGGGGSLVAGTGAAPSGQGPIRLAGQALEGLGTPQSPDNSLVDVALAAIGSGRRGFAGSPGYRQSLAEAVEPMQGIQQRSLEDDYMNAAMAIFAPPVASAGSQPSMTTAGSGGMPSGGGGGGDRISLVDFGRKLKESSGGLELAENIHPELGGKVGGHSDGSLHYQKFAKPDGSTFSGAIDIRDWRRPNEAENVWKTRKAEIEKEWRAVVGNNPNVELFGPASDPRGHGTHIHFGLRDGYIDRATAMTLLEAERRVTGRIPLQG